MTFTNLTVSPCALANSCVRRSDYFLFCVFYVPWNFPLLCALFLLPKLFIFPYLCFRPTVVQKLLYHIGKYKLSSPSVQFSVSSEKSPCSFTSLVSVFLSLLSLPHFRYTLCRKFSLVLVNISRSSQCRPFQLSPSPILSIRKCFRPLFSPLSYRFRSQTVGNHCNVFVPLHFTQSIS